MFCCVAVVFVFLFFVHTSRATEKQEAVLLICLILITTNGNYKDNDNGDMMEQVPKSGHQHFLCLTLLCCFPSYGVRHKKSTSLTINGSKKMKKNDDHIITGHLYTKYHYQTISITPFNLLT